MMSETLTIDKVSVHKSGKPILCDITTTIQGSQIVGVVGANGAGKSTFLSAIARQLSYKGSITWNTNNPTENTIGFMPQSCKVSTALTVLETVILGCHEHLGWRVRPREIDNAMVILDSLGMASLSSRMMTTLSGGQQQLVLLAQRLMRQPQLLVLDEATSALDMAHQISVLGKLRQYVARNKALVLIAIHDLNIAMQYADQLLLLHNGQLLAQDTPENVLTTENIRACYNGLDVELVARPQGRPVIVPNMTLTDI